MVSKFKQSLYITLYNWVYETDDSLNIIKKEVPMDKNMCTIQKVWYVIWIKQS